MIYQWLVLLALATLIALIAWGRIERHWISLAILLMLLITGTVLPQELLDFVDWDVLGLILGMSILTIYLEESGLMDIVAKRLERYLNSPKKLIFWLSFIAGIVSIFLENVTVVLLLAPIVFRLSKSLKISPVLSLIPVALASNMAGSATMVGDPPAIITAGYLNLVFTDFIWYNGKPSMFFMTLVPMVLACALITFIASRSIRYNQGIDIPNNSTDTQEARDTYIDRVFVLEALGFLTLKIVLLSVRHALHLSLSMIALIAVSGLTITRALHRDFVSIKKAIIQGFEWKLILFLIGVFTLSGAFAKHGLAEIVAHKIISLGYGNIFIITSLLILISVLISAFIDNVPYITTMLPVISVIANTLNIEPITIAWAVLLGTTLGGNLTYIGASANVTAIRLLEKNSYRVTFLDFIKLSLPFNTISVVSGWIMYEVIWILPYS